jgi:hypothetical protein
MYQYFGDGGSGARGITINNSAVTFGTSWNRYTFTFNVASVMSQTITTRNFFEIAIKLGSAIGNFTLDTWGWQLEAGSNASAFQTATGTLQGELAACQRYYWRKSAVNNLNSFFATGSAASTTSAFVLLQAPTTMRVPPTAIDFSGCALNDGANSTNVTSLTLNQANENGCWINAVVTSGLTQFRPYVLWTGTNVNAFIGLSSEL